MFRNGTHYEGIVGVKPATPRKDVASHLPRAMTHSRIGHGPLQLEESSVRREYRRHCPAGVVFPSTGKPVQACARVVCDGSGRIRKGDSTRREKIPSSRREMRKPARSESDHNVDHCKPEHHDVDVTDPRLDPSKSNARTSASSSTRSDIATDEGEHGIGWTISISLCLVQRFGQIS